MKEKVDCIITPICPKCYSKDLSNMFVYNNKTLQYFWCNNKSCDLSWFRKPKEVRVFISK